MLKNDAMIIRLSISKWTARKFDRRVTGKVATDYGVNASVGRYRKALVAEEAVKAITKVESEAREFHYSNTLPWDNAGGRLLPAANFQAYSARMRELKAQFETEVKTFFASYSDYRLEAETRLKGMFDPNDYPSESALEAKFAYEVEIEPIPDSADFRVSIQDGEAEKIRAEIEGKVKDREAVAMDDLYNRLAAAVGRFAERLADKDAIFRDSLVDNVLELVELLPRLNVAKDADLEALRKDVKQKLGVYDPKTLREDKDVRAQAAKEAKRILDKMSGYTSARK
jgi:hypothetical protein